jgi:protein-disulfide isomerase
VFTITEDDSFLTPSGRYRKVTVERACDNRMLSSSTAVLIDEMTATVWLGVMGRLSEQGMGGDKLKQHIEKFIPEAMQKSRGIRAVVEWDSSYASTGAVIPFLLRVQSGFGVYKKPAAVTADGKVFILGYPLPYGRDPVAYRRELIQSSKLVTWDHHVADGKVEIVELSDYQCPGCKVKWRTIEKALKTYGSAVSHGMVSFPLTTIHPWAFRSGCAGWCVAQQDPAMVLDIKKLFYSMQQDMSVSDVSPTARDFVVGQGLSEELFDACYLRKQSLDAVHGQIELGDRLGVEATPTYFINGWKIQMPDETWLFPMIQRLIEEKDP